MFECADNAESRMRKSKGNVRSKRTKRGLRPRAVSIVFLMLAVFTLSACRPTPDEPVVVGKNQGDMLSAAAQIPEADIQTIAEQVNVPDAYSANVSAVDGKLKVVADGACITLPDANTLPIVRVKAADFTQTQVDVLCAALFNGQTLYEVQPSPETKDMIMQQIISLKGLKESDEYSSQGDQEQLDEEIALLEKKWQTAPDTGEEIITVSDGKLKQKEVIDDETGNHVAYYVGLNVTTNTEDYQKAAKLWVQNNDDLTQSVIKVDTDKNGKVTGWGGRMLKRMAMLRFENRGDASESNFGQNPPIPVDEDTVIDDAAVLEKMKTTPAQAKTLVETMLQSAGIDNMAVIAMFLEDDANLGNFDGKVSPAEHYAYRLYVCRTVNGIPVSYINGMSSNEGGNMVDEAIKSGDAEALSQAYSSVCEWSYEAINAEVNDAGIITFEWFSPLEIADTVVENSTLLPFESIAKKFEQQMQIQYETQAAENESVQLITFSVDRVALEYQRITEQDSLGNGLLIPVWNFYGTCSAISPEGEDRGSGYLSGDGVYNMPMMTINAVDGSIIDIMKGY